jgi:hypothetical protein
MENIKAALNSVGGGFEHVVKMNTYLTVIATQAPIFREVRDAYLKQGGATGRHFGAGRSARSAGLSDRGGSNRDLAAASLAPRPALWLHRAPGSERSAPLGEESCVIRPRSALLR